MEDKLLVLKWNNHKKSFFGTISKLRNKALYTDVILACDGEYFNVHKIVLSSCSEYFQEIFEKTECKCPVIVLKDIRSSDLKCLLDYMYAGEVEVKQNELNHLISAAECLKIKGLAFSDEVEKDKKEEKKRKHHDAEYAPQKHRKAETPPDNTSIQSQNSCSVSSNNTVSDRLGYDKVETIKLEPEDEIENKSFEQISMKKDEEAVVFENEHFEKMYESLPGPSGIDEGANEWSEENLAFSDMFLPTATSVQSSAQGKCFECVYCPKIFRKKSHWEYHHRTHTGEKPFKCPYCDYRGAQKSNVKSHTIAKHSQFFEKL